MAKSNEINNYREPVPADYPLEYKGYTCQLRVHRDVKLYHEEFGEKSSPISTNLREGLTIPAYDNKEPIEKDDTVK